MYLRIIWETLSWHGPTNLYYGINTRYPEQRKYLEVWGRKGFLEVSCLHLQRYFSFPSTFLTVAPLPASHAELLVYFPNICFNFSKRSPKLWKLLRLFLFLPMLATFKKVKLNKRDIPVAVEFFSNPIIYMRIQFFSIFMWFWAYYPP